MTNPFFVEPPAEFIEAEDGTKIACRFQPGRGPCILFLPGYMSDMQGGKAQALAAWTAAEGRAMLRLDYSGCGESEGTFAEGTLSRWSEEILAAAAHFAAQMPLLLVGSSMGGWLMLLAGIALERKQPGRLTGMVGIAAAPDFTEWGRDAGDKARLAAGETVFDDNPYGPDPTPMHPAFFADGQAQLLLASTIPLDCPVHLLHGQGDRDVPWDISLQLSAALRSDKVQLTLVKDGDHRLSRPQDIDMLIAAVSRLCDQFEDTDP